jgi:hypothetical protein
MVMRVVCTLYSGIQVTLEKKNTPATVNVLKTIVVVWLLVVTAVAVRSCGLDAV